MLKVWDENSERWECLLWNRKTYQKWGKTVENSGEACSSHYPKQPFLEVGLLLKSNLGKNKYVPRTGNSECGKPASSGWLVDTGRCKQVAKVSAQVPSAYSALQGCWGGCGTLQAAPHAKGELGVLPDSSPAHGVWYCTHLKSLQWYEVKHWFRVSLWWSHHEALMRK